jgi:hypothetical protein
MAKADASSDIVDVAAAVVVRERHLLLTQRP